MDDLTTWKWQIDRRRFEREVDEFLHGRHRFRLRTDTNAREHNKIQTKGTDDKRSGSDRRCRRDTRSEIEQFLQGERRSILDQRSRVKGGYRTFKQARAFVRGLGLKSVAEWRSYTKSGMRPDDIPLAPQHIYANDGWAGWGDWLNA